MDKKHKCKICGWKGRLPKIMEEKVFNIECKSWIYKEIACQKCGNYGIVENQTVCQWVILGLIVTGVLFFIVRGFFR